MLPNVTMVLTHYDKVNQSAGALCFYVPLVCLIAFLELKFVEPFNNITLKILCDICLLCENNVNISTAHDRCL